MQIASIVQGRMCAPKGSKESDKQRLYVFGIGINI